MNILNGVDMKRACVFCSASSELSPFFFSEMSTLAKTLVKNQFGVVYGGASCGLMGHLADEALKAGGHVTGVMPDVFEKERTHNGLTHLEMVDDMSERKKQMIEMSDAFVVFPGGIGTIDEAIEVICYKSIQAHSKPIVFINFMGFWNPFFEMLDLIREQRMISGPLSDYYHVVDTSEEAVRYLNEVLGQREYGLINKIDSTPGMAP